MHSSAANMKRDSSTSASAGRDIGDVPFHWQLFLKRYALPTPPVRPSVGLLEGAVTAFAELPIENATHINHLFEHGSRPRTTAALVTQHLLHGTGGLADALAAALAELLELYGFEIQMHQGRTGRDPGPVYMPDHLALTVALEGETWLCDPGLLLARPLPLPADDRPRVFEGYREADLLIERCTRGNVSFLLRSPGGFDHLALIDLAPVERRAIQHAAPESLAVDRLVGRRLWMVRDRAVYRRDPDGRATRYSLGWNAIQDRFGIDAPLLERAWARTPYARAAYRLRTAVTAGAKASMGILWALTSSARSEAPGLIGPGAIAMGAGAGLTGGAARQRA